MEYHYSNHAREQMDKRRIPLSLVHEVLLEPEQKLLELDEITCYQSRVEMNGTPYLLRVMVNDTASPHVVVTVYFTRKLTKYWRSS